MDGSSRYALLAGLGLALIALTGAGLWAQHADAKIAFIVIALVQGAAYLGAAWLSLRGVLPRGAFAIIVAAAAIMRLGVLASPAYLSDDTNRYIWDGRVQGAGINPYRYLPVDDHLAQLRDDAVFPNINRNNYAPTIYPPVAQMIFFGVTRVSERVIVMRAAMLAFEIAGVLALLRLLALYGLPRERILLYLWHPLGLWEIAGSGHIDAAMVALVPLAFWAAARGRDAFAGAALAAAALVKFLPLALFPALWRRGTWRMPAALAATAIAAYAPYIGAGARVLGFLPGYAGEEGLESGGGFYFWKLLTSGWQWAARSPQLPAIGVYPYLIAAAAILGWCAWRALMRSDDGISAFRAGAVLMFAFLVLLSPHYPWYFLVAITFFCVVPYPPMLYLTAASFLLYLPWGEGGAGRFAAESALYGPWAILALGLWWRQWRGTQTATAERGTRP